MRESQFLVSFGFSVSGCPRGRERESKNLSFWSVSGSRFPAPSRKRERTQFLVSFGFSVSAALEEERERTKNLSFWSVSVSRFLAALEEEKEESGTS